ncbi:MAG TPA: hypothetical protein VM914_10385 [Pyrinomonadaceae bacterium]|jgi:hypothetical protein|nr:hypothetical protein [Pyrinomonadaceae bacterium]
MLLFLLLLVLFWAVVPGLIAGWMLHERGRSFWRGLLVGAICGPLGILATLAFIYFSDRKAARRHKHGRGRAFRVFYEVPVVGRLHVSTVWALAGLATFLCAWMIGGIAYEVYLTGGGDAFDAREASAGLQTDSKPRAGQTAQAGSPVLGAPDPKQTANAQGNSSAQLRTSLVGNVAAQAPQPVAGRANNSLNQPGQPATQGASDASTALSRPDSGANAPTSASGAANTPTPAPTAKPSAQGRESAVADVTQTLASRGHRVHASVSGDAQTSTLSLSGATLTREAGNQLLGSGRLRQALKSAGVRIVVMVNGQESWTYML